MKENYMRETEDDAQELYREINGIMEEREGIEKEMREIHSDMELFDDVQREIRGIFKEIWKHCEEDIFIMRLEEYEEDIWDSGRKNENKMEERIEILKEKIRKTFDREDEIREQLRQRGNDR